MFCFQQMRRLRTSYQSFLYITRVRKFVFELRKVRNGGSKCSPGDLPAASVTKRKPLGNAYKALSLETLTVKHRRSVANDLLRSVERRLNFESRKDHRNELTGDTNTQVGDLDSPSGFFGDEVNCAG